MDGLQIYQDIMAAIKKHDELVEGIVESGKTLAAAEKQYRIKKREAELYYRDKGYPASMLGDLAKGQSDIAELAFARDLAQYALDATKESVWGKRQEINVLRDFYSFEFGRNK